MILESEWWELPKFIRIKEFVYSTADISISVSNFTSEEISRRFGLGLIAYLVKEFVFFEGKHSNSSPIGMEKYFHTVYTIIVLSSSRKGR